LLAALAALAALALAALTLLSLLTALAALLSGTIRLISHGKLSDSVDRGCAPSQNLSG